MKLLKIIFFLCLSSKLAYSQSCIYLNSPKLSDDYQLFGSIGNTQLDAYVSKDVNVLRSFFHVQPIFFYYADKPGEENAQTSPKSESSSYPDGTIIFGVNLFRKEWNSTQNLTTIPLIIAHEFGHAVDNKYHAISRNVSTSKKELFADFLAGVFLRYRSQLTLTDINGVLRSFFEKGEYDFTSPDHHGTPDERVNAIQEGYKWYVKNAYNTTINTIISAGQNYVGERRDDLSSGGTSGNVRASISAPESYSNTDGTSTYSYKIHVRNSNNYDVSLTLGGLKYGYYKNCDSSDDNFVAVGEFDEKTVTVAGNSSRDVYLRLKLGNSPPYKCSGVPTSQDVTISNVSRQ